MGCLSRQSGGAFGAAMNLFFSFKGRATRLQYWLGNLLLFVLMGVALVGWVAALQLPQEALSSGQLLLAAVLMKPGMLVALVAILLAIQVCAAAITVKRYHDRGKRGWWYFVLLVPYIGPLWQLIECGFFPGEQGRNRFDAAVDHGAALDKKGALTGASLLAGPPAHRLERAIAVSAAKQTHNARFGRRSYQ
jgi:uncharacterized membrane protein YhaH (DUF805 family)